MHFMVAPEVLREVNHMMKMNKTVLRWINVKRGESEAAMPPQAKEAAAPQAQEPQQQ